MTLSPRPLPSYFLRMTQTLPMHDPSAIPSIEMDEQRFEDVLARLQGIVDELEAGKTDLESALQRYEEGVALARHCLGRLERAELRVQELALE